MKKRRPDLPGTESVERVIIAVRADKTTRKRWKDAAAREGMALSTWIRRAGDRAVEVEGKQETIRKVALS